MPSFSDHEHLLQRTKDWLRFAYEPGGDQYFGCPDCGRVWDLGELIQCGMDDIARDGLPCRCPATPFPFAVLREKETYGF